MDKKEFLSKEQCLTLSELNYDGDYDFVYHATGELWERGRKDKKERFLPAPLKQQVLRWFREKYDFHYTIQHGKQYVGIVYSSIENFSIEAYDTYEEAENNAIYKLIELTNNKTMYTEEEVYDLLVEWDMYQKGEPRVDEDEIPNGFMSFNEWFKEISKQQENGK